MEGLFRQILSLSITGSIVILAVLLARLLLQPFPRKYSYALWAVAGFRLCCPVTFRWNYSLFTYVPDGESAIEQLPAVEEGLGAITALPARIDLWQILAWIWVLGAAAMVVYSLASWLRLRYSLRSAVRLEEGVYESDTIRSPFILGLLRPRIYVPFAMSPENRAHVLAHERCHLKRGDYLVKAFAYGLLALHWFNPLCYIAFGLIGKDMELCCDEAVLASGEVDKKSYCETLVSVAARKHRFAALPLAFGESSVKSRVKNALAWRRPKLWMALVALALCVVVGAACAADPVSDTPSLAAGEYRWMNQSGRVPSVTVTEDQLRYGSTALSLADTRWETAPYTQEAWEGAQRQLRTPMGDISDYSYMLLAQKSATKVFLLWKDSQLWLMQEVNRIIVLGGELIPAGSDRDPVVLSFQAVEEGIQRILEKGGDPDPEDIYAQIKANEDTYKTIRKETYALEYICHAFREKKPSGREEILLTILLSDIMDRMGEPVAPDLMNGRQWFEDYVNQSKGVYASMMEDKIPGDPAQQQALAYYAVRPASFYILSYLGELD